MELDIPKVKGIAAKVGKVGDEVGEYVARARGDIEQAGDGNVGFASVKTYKDVAVRLNEQTVKLAERTSTSGESIATAAANHDYTDSAQALKLHTAGADMAV